MSNVTVQEALRAAIEAMEYHTEQTRPIQKTIDTLAACKAALAEIDKCEPVKGVVIREGLPTLLSDKYIKATDIRLYTSPQPREWVELDLSWILSSGFRGTKDEAIRYARVVEAKLKKVNTKG